MPYSLERYTEIREWDNGYLVVMAKYAHSPEPEEEYIDLVPICYAYNDLRSTKLAQPLYPSEVLLLCELLHSDAPKEEALSRASTAHHVVCIVAVNRCITAYGGYADARDQVRILGVAPDAQLFTMNDFDRGNPFDSDYMVVISAGNAYS